jgi:hypothetical protein
VLAGDPDGVLVGPYFAERFADTFAAASTDILGTAGFVSPSSRPGEESTLGTTARV